MHEIFVTSRGQASRSLRAAILADRVRAFRVTTSPACPMVRVRS